MDAGQRQEISILYQQMYPLLMEYARSTLSNDALAEEAVQDTFVIACQKPASLCASPNPQGWLVNTLKYVISNTLRSQRTAAHILADYLAVNLETLLITWEQPSPELLYGDLTKTEEFQLLKEIALDEKSYLEMARERGITVETCRKRVQRAREFLQKKIKK